MANIDPTSSTAPAGSVPSAIAQTAEAFSRHEWDVIELARQDGLSSLRDPSSVARAIGRLFGAGLNRRLADPRLEALRRFAVLAWHNGYALPTSAIKAFKAAGFDLDQLEAMLARILAVRSTFTGRTWA